MAFGPLDIHQLRHPKAHTPEILTGRENAARHLAADLSAAATDIHRTLATRAFTKTDDDDAVLNAAGDALAAAVAIIRLFDGTPQLLMLERMKGRYIDVDQHPGAEIWPFRLSVILAAVFRKTVAYPSDTLDLLTWMTGATGLAPLGSDRSVIAADFCAPSLCSQYPALARTGSLPAIPAVADDVTTARRSMPDEIEDWVAKIARLLGDDRPDPELPVRQLAFPERLHVRHQFELIEAEDDVPHT